MRSEDQSGRYTERTVQAIFIYLSWSNRHRGWIGVIDPVTSRDFTVTVAHSVLRPHGVLPCSLTSVRCWLSLSAMYVLL